MSTPVRPASDAGYIAARRPVWVPGEAAAFARAVVVGCGPLGRGRAKNLLWAAGKLVGWAIPLGLKPVPGVLLHPSVIERFTAHSLGLSGPARRTLRTNLRFIARAVAPHLDPADQPLPRERAKARDTAAEISGFLALADAQPSVARRMRAAGLVCLGAGAGLIRADLRAVRGTDVACRSGGVLVQVRDRRPRSVPLLARYQDRLLAVLEDIIDNSGAAPRIEALLPRGVRGRQLAARTLLIGMLMALADDRPAHLTRVHPR
jgi:integrase